MAGLRPPRPRTRLGRRPRSARQLPRRTRTREPDGFLAGANDEFALCYYDEGELGFIHPAGREFTVYDRFHCSLMASTWPNRYYKWSAQSGGKRNNDPPAATLGNQWETVFDRAIARGLTARYYNSDLPFSAVWGARGATWTRPVADYYADCAAGTLPNITFVDPPFRDGGGGDGMSADEHPLGDVRLGQAFMSDVVHAFIESPNWERGALFIVYDEWGGFFDHVRPPSVPDVRRSSNIDDDFGLMGYRIPAVTVSPFAKRGAVSHLLCGFESIIKLITYRFGLGSLTTRDARAQNIGHSMSWSQPRLRAARPARPRSDRLGPVHARAAATCSTASRRTPATSRRSRTLPSASAFRPAPAPRPDLPRARLAAEGPPSKPPISRAGHRPLQSPDITGDIADIGHATAAFFLSSLLEP